MRGITPLNKKDLIAFEEDIKEEFNKGNIRSPIHLSRGNEPELIDIFRDLDYKDWVFSTHRNHYHALLKGFKPRELKRMILEGRSMHIMSKRHHFFSSAIVAGNIGIALGVAMAQRKKNLKGKVWVFVGDMAAESGLYFECLKYAERNSVPLNVVVEDNKMSTNTPTKSAWGWSIHPDRVKIERYRYKRVLPHINTGTFVVFK